MPPNILFIVCDDLNAWIGALGRHPQAHTPNIDALAARGALFVNAYCSAPYCNASRMGFFTGRLPSTLGVYANEPFWDAPDRPLTFIELLREAGYFMFGSGKVFHGVFDYAAAGQERTPSARWKEIENRDAIWDQYVSNTSEPLPNARPVNGLFDFTDFANVPDKYHLFDWGPLPNEVEPSLPDSLVATAVSEFVSSPREKPFFCAAGFYKPHLPWHAPQRFFDLYADKRITLPLVKDDDLDDVPPIGKAWALDPPDHELVTSRGVWPDAVRGYLASMSYADAMVGRVIDALDRSPARDNTAIILCGDNGFHLGEKLHWRKFALWEEATRVPLIYVPPGGLTNPLRPTQPVSLIDIFPTILKLAGIDARACDGASLLPLLDTPHTSERKPVITTWGKGNHSLRTERWRYTRYADGEEELYDHSTDPHEWTNLARLTTFRGLCQNFSELVSERCPESQTVEA